MDPVNQLVPRLQNQDWGAADQGWVAVNQNQIVIPLRQQLMAAGGFGNDQIAIIQKAGKDLADFSIESNRAQLADIQANTKAGREAAEKLFVAHIDNTRNKTPDQIGEYTGELARQLNLAEAKFINVLPAIVDVYSKQRAAFQQTQIELMNEYVRIRGEVIDQTLNARANLIAQERDIQKIELENQKAIDEMARIAKEFENDQKRIDLKLDREFELAKSNLGHAQKIELDQLEQQIKIKYQEQERLDKDQANQHKADEHARELELLEKQYIQKLGAQEADRKWESDQYMAKEKMLQAELQVHLQMHQAQIQIANNVKDKYGKNVKVDILAPRIDKENGVIIPGHVKCEGEDHIPVPVAPPPPVHRHRRKHRGRFKIGRLARKLIGF